METGTTQNILLTGATSGIGRAIALQLAKEGNVKLALCGRNNDKLNALLAGLNPFARNRIYARAFDATDEEAVKQFVQTAVAEFGTIDVLINCAGANTARKRLEDLETSELEYLLRLNAVSPFIFTREIIPLMKARQSGTIVNILSSACLFATETMGAYIAGKAAFDGITHVLRREMRPYHVRVCAVYPGGVDTPFRAVARPDYLKPETVATAVINAINLPAEAAIDEIVLRPFIENNYR